MKKCLKCGTQLPDESLFCSNCGATVTQVTEMNKNGIKKYAPYIIGVFALICLFGFLAYSATSDNKTIAPITESDLQVILNNMIGDESGDAVDKYCTELFKTKYKDACIMAEDEGYEPPRLWWQYSDSDPEKCEIEGLEMVSDTEAKATFDSAIVSTFTTFFNGSKVMHFAESGETHLYKFYKNSNMFTAIYSESYETSEQSVINSHTVDVKKYYVRRETKSQVDLTENAEAVRVIDKVDTTCEILQDHDGYKKGEVFDVQNIRYVVCTVAYKNIELDRITNYSAYKNNN